MKPPFQNHFSFDINVKSKKIKGILQDSVNTTNLNLVGFYTSFKILGQSWTIVISIFNFNTRQNLEKKVGEV